ncbi:MAG: hypothetical protein J7K61_05100 [Thermoplasmata archaeon]|nr:hypothetical protein [Thermoplasmata archaeon]
MKKVAVLIISIILFASGLYYGYEDSKRLNESRCLGCIALLPKAASFSTFWVEYPPFFHKKGIPAHPEAVLNESREHVVMLFFWDTGCDPCKEQWEEMKAKGIVDGSESDGRMTGNFSNITLFSIDIFNEKDGLRWLNVYTPAENPSSTPTTVILFTKNNTTYWYAFSGKADGKAGRPDLNKLEEILNEAMVMKDDM